MNRKQMTDDGRQSFGRSFAVQSFEICRTAAYVRRPSALSPQSSERGFSLVTAIFLLVVIAALGVFAVTLSTTQQQSAALDVTGSRAYQAARAGVEWGAYQIIRSGVAGGVFTAACQTGGAQSQPGALPGTLAGFTVTVECSATSYDEAGRTAVGGNPLWVYRLTSSASGVAGAQTGSPDYVERQMTVTIAQ